MELLTASLLFILGSIIGSFLSVITYRTHVKEKGIVSGRSKCPNCKEPIKWHNLIPIISWLALRGRCGECGKKISSHYLVMEVSTGLLFLLAFTKWNFLQAIGSSVNPDFSHYAIDWQSLSTLIFYLIEFTFLAAIFFYDLIYKEIPDRFSLPAIAIAFVGGLLLNILSWQEMLIGAAIIGGFFFLQFILSKGKWIGGGDIRLGILIGVLLGWKFGAVATIIAYFIGAILSMHLLLNKKVDRKTEIAFGPFLVAGTLIALFNGPELLEWYLRTMTF